MNIASKARVSNAARTESSTTTMANVAGECACGVDGSAEINGVSVDGALLRSLELTDPYGARKQVSDLVGTEGKAVVVYLRHLG